MSYEVVQIPHDPDAVRSHVSNYKAFRLLSLQTAPDAFISTYARESAFPDETWYERLANPFATTFVAFQSDHIVSTLTLLGPLPNSAEESSPLESPWAAVTQDVSVSSTGADFLHFRINGMFTLPGARQQGIAKALIDGAIRNVAERAKESGKDGVVTIAVESENLPAKLLYIKCGFAVIKEEQLVHSDGKTQGVLLLKHQNPLNGRADGDSV